MYSERKNMLCVILIIMGGGGGVLIAQLQAKCTMCREWGCVRDHVQHTLTDLGEESEGEMCVS